MNSSTRIYTRHHAWLISTPASESSDNSQEYTLGITDYAQQQLGDIVFVDLPEIGQKTQAEEACLVVESVKSASDVICPVVGEITQVNQALADEPELINESPYDQGWIVRIKVDNNSAIESKMTQDEYNALIAEDA